MKSQPRTIISDGIEYQALCFICPGCEAEGGGSGLHMLPVNAPKELQKPSWDWDGNFESPTVSPSILTGRGSASGKICHSFLRNGIFEFLSDCTHPLANQKVPMPDLPDWFINE